MKHPERDLQKAAHRYMQSQYPAVLAFAVPNGGSRHAREAENLKKQGVTAGIPDYLIFMQTYNYSGLAIEFKAGKNKPTAAQEAAMHKIKVQGWRVEVIRDFDTFKSLVDEYLNKTP